MFTDQLVPLESTGFPVQLSDRRWVQISPYLTWCTADGPEMASIMCTYANDDHFTYRPFVPSDGQQHLVPAKAR